MGQSVEFTQSFSFTISAAGISLNYLPLNQGASPPPAGSKYVIKELDISATFDIEPSTYPPDFAVRAITSNDEAGTNAHQFFVQNPVSPIAAYSVVQAVKNSTQIISEQPYIGVSVNASAAGTLFVVISYIIIPAGSLAVNDFNAVALALGLGVNNILGASTTNTRLLKSINVLNYIGSDFTFDVQLIATDSAQNIKGYLSDVVTLTPGAMTTFTNAFYIYPDSTTQIGINVTSPGGGTDMNLYLSYIELTET